MLLGGHFSYSFTKGTGLLFFLHFQRTLPSIEPSDHMSRYILPFELEALNKCIWNSCIYIALKRESELFKGQRLVNFLTDTKTNISSNLHNLLPLFLPGRIPVVKS